MGMMYNNRKYLRGYADFNGEKRQKKRKRKNKNKASEAPPDERALPDEGALLDEEEDPQEILFLRLYEQFPLVADFVREHRFYYVFLLSSSTNATIIIFFYFCHKFLQLVDIVHWEPRLLVSLVYLRGSPLRVKKSITN